MITFVPVGERVIVKPTEQEQQTGGGIYLPDTAKEKPQEGEVVAVGPGRVSDDGTRLPMELAKGDRVIYSKFAGTEYKEGDEEYMILRESDILAHVSGSQVAVQASVSTGHLIVSNRELILETVEEDSTPFEQPHPMIARGKAAFRILWSSARHPGQAIEINKATGEVKLFNDQ